MSLLEFMAWIHYGKSLLFLHWCLLIGKLFKPETWGKVSVQTYISGPMKAIHFTQWCIFLPNCNLVALWNYVIFKAFMLFFFVLICNAGFQSIVIFNNCLNMMFTLYHFWRCDCRYLVISHRQQCSAVILKNDVYFEYIFKNLFTLILCRLFLD